MDSKGKTPLFRVPCGTTTSKQRERRTTRNSSMLVGLRASYPGAGAGAGARHTNVSFRSSVRVLDTGLSGLFSQKRFSEPAKLNISLLSPVNVQAEEPETNEGANRRSATGGRRQRGVTLSSARSASHSPSASVSWNLSPGRFSSASPSPSPAPAAAVPAPPVEQHKKREQQQSLRASLSEKSLPYLAERQTARETLQKKTQRAIQDRIVQKNLMGKSGRQFDTKSQESNRALENTAAAVLGSLESRVSSPELFLTTLRDRRVDHTVVRAMSAASGTANTVATNTKNTKQVRGDEGFMQPLRRGVHAYSIYNDLPFSAMISPLKSLLKRKIIVN